MVILKIFYRARWNFVQKNQLREQSWLRAGFFFPGLGIPMAGIRNRDFQFWVRSKNENPEKMKIPI